MLTKENCEIEKKLNQIAQISKILWENLVQEQALRLIS